MPTLVCLGMGYCARYHVSAFGARFDRCVGTTRRAEPVPPPGQQRLGDRAVEILPFDATSHELAVAISQADALLISAAPDEGRDPVLAAFADAIARAPRLRFVVYLSTIGVYGDSGGSWISETAPAAAAATGRARVRIDAEFAWQALGAQRNLPVAIFRLGGIYGPERNALVRLLRGTVHRIAKAGHVSNRIHVHDIAQAIDAVFARRADGVFNIVDDEPAPPSDPIAFAASRHRPAARNPLCGGPPAAVAFCVELLRRLHPGAQRQAQDRARRETALSDVSRGPARALPSG